MLQGVADLIFLDEEKDCYVLVDYKTDRTKDAEALKQRYSLQLRLYARAFGKILDRPVDEAYIYSFEIGQISVM